MFCIGSTGFSFLTLIVMTPARQVAETDGVKTCKDPSDCDLNKLYMIAYMIVHVIGISKKFTFASTRQLSILLALTLLLLSLYLCFERFC